jgi:MarR family transcriptional regulator, organic hydroperoxide resistance regulator
VSSTDKSSAHINKNTIDFSIDSYFKTWWLLHQARDVTFRVRSRELSQFNITTEQAAILFIVNILNNQNKKSTPGEISKWILREPHSVSKILSRMEKEGFINKTNRMGKKRNEVHISLTVKGNFAYEKSLKRESVRGIMACLSDEECQQLTILLEKIIDKGLQELTRKSQIFFP